MKFVDERIQMDQWPALKASGKFPLGQLPVLEFEDGTQITQNQAIMRYVAAVSSQFSQVPTRGLSIRQ